MPLAARLEQEIHAGRVELPVLPQVADEVQQLVDRDADLSALVHVIEREPAMAAALVKYANSAMYAGLRDVTEVQSAIMRLGLAAVKQAVLSLSAKAAFASPIRASRRSTRPSGCTRLTEQKDLLAALIQVVDMMAAKVGASLNPNPDIRLVDRPAFVLLGLDDARVASLLVDLEDERQTLEAIF